MKKCTHLDDSPTNGETPTIKYMVILAGKQPSAGVPDHMTICAACLLTALRPLTCVYCGQSNRPTKPARLDGHEADVRLCVDLASCYSIRTHQLTDDVVVYSMHARASDKVEIFVYGQDGETRISLHTVGELDNLDWWLDKVWVEMFRSPAPSGVKFGSLDNGCVTWYVTGAVEFGLDGGKWLEDGDTIMDNGGNGRTVYVNQCDGCDKLTIGNTRILVPFRCAECREDVDD